MNWKNKLTSRKFWMAVTGFVTAVLTALHVNDLAIEQVVTIIGALGTLVAYILAEGYVDGKREENAALVLDEIDEGAEGGR